MRRWLLKRQAGELLQGIIWRMPKQLVSLGYKLTEATKMLADVDPNQTTEALIKAALTKRMSVRHSAIACTH